jgi:2',3'-cyclic-nucleotide 2'-phosphodiesterase (5'-nucleotidase family)
MIWFRCRRAVIGLLLLAAAASAIADNVRLVILHTNDLHDHVRAGDNGLGGLPYVSGYINQVRAAEKALLVLDAGDVTEKGDLVAFKSHGEMTYEAMRRIGYDGVALGNHDFDDVGVEGVRRYERVLGQGLLCLNIVRPDGAPVFTASRVVTVGGTKVALIGMIAPRNAHVGGLDLAASGQALAREAERLRSEAPLIVAVCHESVAKCAGWSRAAPAVQVFISGHSHDAQERPFIVPETGAIIVQAGSYARWVGRLEVEFDSTTRKITRHDGRLVPMRHAEITVDREMLAWVGEREEALAPEAKTFVFDNPTDLDGFAIARLAADGLRRAAKAEIGFCHVYQVIRDNLPAGRVDVNGVFKTGGQRGFENIEIELSGAEIEAYVNALVALQREPPEWSGFRISRHVAAGGGETWTTDLEPHRRYRVVMPKIEWETRFLRLAARAKERDPRHPLALRTFSPQPLSITFTDATVAYIKQVLSDGVSVKDRAAQIARDRER